MVSWSTAWSRSTTAIARAWRPANRWSSAWRFRPMRRRPAASASTGPTPENSPSIPPWTSIPATPCLPTWGPDRIRRSLSPRGLEPRQPTPDCGEALNAGRSLPTSRRARAVEESVPVTGQQPVGMGPCQFNEAEDRECGDGTTALVVMQGPEGDLQGLCKERAAVLAVEIDADGADPLGQILLESLRVGIAERFIHGEAAISYEPPSRCSCPSAREPASLIFPVREIKAPAHAIHPRSPGHSERFAWVDSPVVGGRDRRGWTARPPIVPILALLPHPKQGGTRPGGEACERARRRCRPGSGAAPWAVARPARGPVAAGLWRISRSS